jgi:hypothetical protein
MRGCARSTRGCSDYVADRQGGVDRWNKVIEKAGIAFKFVQPHKGFNRKIGEFAGRRISPAGEVLTEDEWEKRSGAWLPNDDEQRRSRLTIARAARSRQPRGHAARGAIRSSSGPSSRRRSIRS